MSPAWPSLVPVSAPINEHAVILKQYIEKVEASDKSQAKSPMPYATWYTLMNDVQNLCNQIINQPSQEAMMTVLQNIERTNKIIEQKTINIEHDIESTNSTLARSKTSWASVAASPGGSGGIPSTSSLPKQPATNSKMSSVLANQRGFTVKITNKDIIQAYRQMSNEQLQNHIQKALQNSGDNAIKQLEISAAKQLKSGDIYVYTKSMESANILRDRQEWWTPRLGTGAHVPTPTYGVLVHGFPTTFDPKKPEHIAALELENQNVVEGFKTAFVGWLTVAGSKKKHSSLIIEFINPAMANKMIDEVCLWKKEMFQVVKYDKALRLKQCFNCHRYGHIGTQCRDNAKCGHCAKNHPSKECTTPHNLEEIKCANCNGKHFAWSNTCRLRKQELERIKIAESLSNMYHHIPNPNSTTPPLTLSLGSIQNSQPSTIVRRPNINNSQNRRYRERTRSPPQLLQPSQQQSTPSEWQTAIRRSQRGRIPNRRLSFEHLNTEEDVSMTNSGPPYSTQE